MAGVPGAHLCLRVGARYRVAFVPFPARAPLFTIDTGSALVSFTLPDRVEAGHVEFARRLAAQAWAYAVAVERQYRGLPQLADLPVPYALTPEGQTVLEELGQAGALPPSGRQEVTA